MTSSSLLHLSTLFHLLPEICWNILSAGIAFSHFPSTFCYFLCYLFMLFKKCYFTIILVRFRHWVKQTMLSLGPEVFYLTSFIPFIQYITPLLKIKSRLLLFCGLFQEVSCVIVLPSFILFLASPVGSLSFSRLSLHFLQPFSSPPYKAITGILWNPNLLEK